MKPGARLAAAVEILTEILERHRPAALALSDWGRSHRFAGSGDRSAIGNLVYDALRRKLSLAAMMQADTPRALAIAAAPRAFAMTPAQVEGLADGSQHALSAFSPEECAGLARLLEQDAGTAGIPDHIRADVPDWLAPSLAAVFGDRLVAEGEALARRAPVDLRTNTLKTTREKLIAALAKTGAAATPWTSTGVRIAPPDGPGRTPNVEADPAHGKGWFEVQDEASQIAATLAGAGPRMQVLDLCAGAGGKTLAFGAAMQNTGQIYAYDRDKHQLRPIFERLQRAGVRNVQIVDPGEETALDELGPRFDLVFVDAPCTGSGT
ncbi:MAG: RsmB/NOP family class I SAM-dependent RNA methyltransferase, partial [Hyphomicrobiaceae bacterium]|nr:RsmB/NOP family class I SAM-dependent RNA methyltransferase [Hyphomicrobiaceae bacterium]